MTDSTDTGKTEERDQEEPTVKVKDRRLLSEEERTGVSSAQPEAESPAEDSSSGAQEPEQPEQAEQPSSAEEQTAGAKPEVDSSESEQDKTEETRDPTINEVLAMCVSMLAAHAWQRLGLQVSPMSGELVKDLEEARVAIDSLEGLVEQLRRRLSPKEADELQAMLSNLRVNFVQQSSS